ncbi:MAG: hypothetical protein JXM70_07890 [Pirellulales bacterium]|nr:hypothetical protein [Pirellulales bacterium]
MSEQKRCKAALDRRALFKGITGGVVGLGVYLHGSRSSAATPSTAGMKINPLAARLPIWKLKRPKPALPNSYFWTWDHSTNWMLDDPGMLNFGCDNRYLKQAKTYVEDYRRLTDLAAGLGVKGIVIWGFLRDAHGGIDSARRIVDYANTKGVAIMPGFGTNEYGGAYYEGAHPYNMMTFLQKYPDARSIREDGQPRRRDCVCPSHPRFVPWLQEGLHWIFKEFDIGGLNLENGDFMMCHCAKCKSRREKWTASDPDFWRHQYLGYAPALEAIGGQSKNKLITWATYKGFLKGNAPAGSFYEQRHAYMECDRPALLDKLPAEALCQWTLTGMVRERPLPLTKYLDDGVPADSLASNKWPAAVKPPASRNTGFLHQGSQWGQRSTRYDLVVGTIKEGCLRAYRAGLEGVSIHGEVSSMHVPWALNYLAFSHFTHWPEDSLRQFGSKTLEAVLGSAEEGEAFAELLAHWDAKTLSEQQKADLRQRNAALRGDVLGGSHLERWRFWNWLAAMAEGGQDRQTVSVF